jgi:transposase
MPHCNPYIIGHPLENSVLIMDNASIHRGPEIREMYAEFGVLLEYTPPYSPDYNPIEEPFAELKAWMRRNRELAEAFGPDEYGEFIELAVRSLTFKAGRHFRTCLIHVPEEDLQQ